MTSPLHESRPVERFTDRATDYALYRPSYPGGAIDCVLEDLGDPSALVAADVGAGTGISARLLADRGVGVIAIEPNAAMRGAAATHERVAWRDGTAERTGLPDASLDLVVVAQAFHWFRPAESLAEFVRIVRPGGRVALMWNARDRSDAFTDEFSSIVLAADASESRVAAESRLDPNALSGVAGLRMLAPRVFVHRQPLDADGLVGRAVSASYMPKSGAGHDAAVAALRALHSRHADSAGRVDLVYRTLVFRATRL